MRHFFIILIITAMGLKVFAGADSTDVAKQTVVHKHAHYLSINGTFFLQEFFSFANSTAVITPSPYIIEYKYLPGNHGFRMDLGGNFSSKKSYLDSSQVQINRTASLNFRIGYIYQKKLTKHWSIFTGADVVGTFSPDVLKDNSTLDIVTTTNNAYTVGFGPALGIQFAINNRIGLFTETAFYYQAVFSKQTSTSLNFPELNSSTNSIENDLRFVIPVSLFFYVRL
jgi:hypothetical protein